MNSLNDSFFISAIFYLFIKTHNGSDVCADIHRTKYCEGHESWVTIIRFMWF